MSHQLEKIHCMMIACWADASCMCERFKPSSFWLLVRRKVAEKRGQNGKGRKQRGCKRVVGGRGDWEGKPAGGKEEKKRVRQKTCCFLVQNLLSPV